MLFNLVPRPYHCKLNFNRIFSKDSLLISVEMFRNKKLLKYRRENKNKHYWIDRKYRIIFWILIWESLRFFFFKKWPLLWSYFSRYRAALASGGGFRCANNFPNEFGLFFIMIAESCIRSYQMHFCSRYLTLVEGGFFPYFSDSFAAHEFLSFPFPILIFFLKTHT